MKWQAIKAFCLGSALALGAQTLSAETVSVEYQFNGNTGVDMSGMTGAPMAVNAFTDSRDLPGNEATVVGEDNLTLEGSTFAELVRQALVASFESSNAELGEGGNLSLDGEIVELEFRPGADGLEMVLRTELTLYAGSRNAWQSTLLSSVRTEFVDFETAIYDSMDRLISELFYDDYFLLALGL